MCANEERKGVRVHQRERDCLLYVWVGVGGPAKDQNRNPKGKKIILKALKTKKKCYKNRTV